MKRTLFVVNQLFQFMVACQIKLSLLQNDYTDILFVETSAGIRNLYNNILKNNIFNNVYITKRETINNTFDKLTMFKKYIFSNSEKTLKEIGYAPKKIYDRIFINEFSFYSCLLAIYLSEDSDSNLELYSFEEGYGSYLNPFGSISNKFLLTLKIKDLLFDIYGKQKNEIFNLFKGFYFFSPELIQFQTKRNFYKIPEFDFKNEKFYDFLNKSYDLSEENEFDRKYIFFEENIPDGTIDDFALVMKIAEKVGKENLIVKLHPRRPVDRFSKYGIKVSRSVGIPWEAFLMKYDFSDKVIMTISSSVAFSSRLYFNSRIKTYMLFRLFDSLNPNISDKKKFISYVKKFKQKYNDKNFIISKNEENFFNEL